MKYESWLFGRDGALFRAAATGRIELVRQLIAEGANVNAASRNGYTPLHRAAQNGHEAIVNILLSHNAVAGAMTANKLSPLDLATQSGHASIADLLRKKA